MAPGRNADQLQHGLQGQIDLLPRGRSVVAVFLRDANASHCRCATFPNVRSAEAFIEARLRRHGRQGFLAFWTLAGRPNGETRTACERKPEVMAVIAETPELVQPLAFADIESARAFVEYYTQRRPHMPAPVICWAIPIRISTTGSGGVRLSPSSPPCIDDQAADGEATETRGTGGEAGTYEKRHIDF